ncbi:MAG: hypothetical protein MJZ57_07875, partial [Bacteroidales bacterium]|nr:hypothetical protein [Bacteroidales bacterium]
MKNLIRRLYMKMRTLKVTPAWLVLLIDVVIVLFSALAGVCPVGQRRRAFLAYLERERAVPYRQVVPYNCWYEYGLNPTEE